MSNTLFEIVNSWFVGMVIVMIIYHASAYIFTKDKSVLFYSLHLLLILAMFALVGNNHLNSNNYISLFQNTNLWFLFFLVWIVFGWFFYFFMKVELELPKLAKQAKIYLWGNTIIFGSLYIFDLLFLSHKYFFKYFYSLLYIPGAILFVIWILYSIREMISKLKPYFIAGFYPFFIVSIYFIYAIRFPNNSINTLINPLFILQLGIILQILIISIALGYKYQILRSERIITNQKLIIELQKSQDLKNITNQKLNENAIEASKELEKAVKKAKQHKIEELENKYKGELEKLKLNSLLSNMNPHFLFNSLNSVKSYIIENNPKKASYYLNKFSKLIRKILDASNETETSLLEELKTMRLYTSIENIRFNNEIIIYFKDDTSLDLETIKVPPLFMHPFLENAIWLGLASKSGEKRIKVVISKSETHIIITIQDNGIGREKAIKILNNKKFKNDKLNLFNFIHRLNLFYAKSKHKHHIKYTDLIDDEGNAKGTLVTLKLPSS